MFLDRLGSVAVVIQKGNSEIFAVNERSPLNCTVKQELSARTKLAGYHAVVLRNAYMMRISYRVPS